MKEKKRFKGLILLCTCILTILSQVGSSNLLTVNPTPSILRRTKNEHVSHNYFLGH